MRRVTFFAILVIALATPTFANTGTYENNRSPVRSFLRLLVKALDLEHISLPPG
jgi:hypothetical protein